MGKKVGEQRPVWPKRKVGRKRTLGSRMGRALNTERRTLKSLVAVDIWNLHLSSLPGDDGLSLLTAHCPSVRSSSHRTGMVRPGGSCLCSCLVVLALLPSLSLAQYESWPQYPEYFQQPAPEYHRPQVPSDVTKIQLRLAGQKRKHSEGWVEVYYNGQWGTVCDDDFSIHAAHVVCRELGYVEAKSWTASSSYGKGEGKTLCALGLVLGSPGSPRNGLACGSPGKGSCTYCQEYS